MATLLDSDASLTDESFKEIDVHISQIIKDLRVRENLITKEFEYTEKFYMYNHDLHSNIMFCYHSSEKA